MRQMTEANLAYPVLVQIEGSSGTGFFLEKNNKTYFVTAKHVLCNNNSFKGNVANLTFQARNSDPSIYFPMKLSLDLQLLLADQHAAINPTRDIVVILIIGNNANEGEFVHPVRGINISGDSQGGFTRIPEISIKQLSEVIIANDIFIFGYPVSIGLQNSPQFNYELPLTRKGVVSQVHAPNKTIILDCQVHPGNSGGPVIQVTNTGTHFQYDVIGVLIQYVPYVTEINLGGAIYSYSGRSVNDFKNSGYSIAASMDLVLETIDMLK
ncbi:trypsin-like peptidase domain-containing protein [Chryseobacterium sp. KMC2]|uniref:trypsin-like peptidase domain-containing protein n=1 Tax=Chryseobacterium sp. KMC2 TaxID=2800705 RepID=UPI001924F60E|nr:trypsin-like peptidase domain-containing protein [Chryseobacterium sp. KMC2]MBL3549152.1 trypsin-like peptidase domain-containing protein [Chryseobacterium sp. KMC2]